MGFACMLHHFGSFSVCFDGLIKPSVGKKMLVRTILVRTKLDKYYTDLTSAA